MSHDELLARIKHYELKPWSDMPDDKDELAAALRAVVELHKPDHVGECMCTYGIAYPCPTIQAIEKELI